MDFLIAGAVAVRIKRLCAGADNNNTKMVCAVTEVHSSDTVRKPK